MEGPTVYENWKAHLEGVSTKSTFEYPLFTDAHIIGGVIEEYGPYQFINTIASAIPRIRQSRPAIVLRADIHLTFDPAAIPMDQTDDERYHGGYLQDEIAALVSLAMGIRLKSGGFTRRFSPTDDPKGYPSYWDFRDDPVLPTGIHGVIVPRAIGTHHLRDAKSLLSLSAIQPEDVIPLVRAARLYQDGLWIAESEPELSWLMFVSAIETAANRWRTTSETPLDRLRASRPKLEEMLKSYGGDQLVLQVADEIAPYMGSTNKFIDFILQFLPDPPTIRPNEWAQHPWDTKGMKKSLGKVYKYRSRALHGGTPFPAPMSMPPHPLGDEGVLTEIPSGLATSTKGGVWLAEDTPILLWIFHDEADAQQSVYSIVKGITGQGLNILADILVELRELTSAGPEESKKASKAIGQILELVFRRSKTYQQALRLYTSRFDIIGGGDPDDHISRFVERLLEGEEVIDIAE